MNTKQDFIKAGFSVVDTENKENKLIAFLKEHYPSVIKDGEINLQELKAAAGLPIDEKVNGYGLNFVGRNFARAKYAQKTEKELKLNTGLSKNIDTTQNLVLKGDNLDCLKILKNYYSGKIKCIYIDPPYNTANDEFVYPDKFDKEEAEVLGLANLSEDDFARMEFAFSTKKSHNGWLAFMYPRLLLARDLLSKDGVIFISIDDNEQANLKLLCDDVFGEENFVGVFLWKKNKSGNQNSNYISVQHDYIVSYVKINGKEKWRVPYSKEDLKDYKEKDSKGLFYWKPVKHSTRGKDIEIYLNGERFYVEKSIYDKNTLLKMIESGEARFFKNSKNEIQIYKKQRLGEGLLPYSILDSGKFPMTEDAVEEVSILFNNKSLFDNPKPIKMIKHFIQIGTSKNDIILDFFAGSGTTGHAVMELNAEDGGNRKFILVQIDEPIKEDKPAYKFCIENKLPPVISSITIERLKRAGEKIKKEIEEANSQNGMFEEDKKQVPDIGFKVFDTVDAPKLKADDTGQIQFPELKNDAISRIYNMIFTVGLDEPTQVPEEVVKDCVYRIGSHYYITNEETYKEETYKVFKDLIGLGLGSGSEDKKIFIDGWTASLNGTLQNYKENVKIVF